ncbi:TAXI family TRAP transporter solute-binding subunit [Cloacibacillus sp.]|uniref:TAXI family TRAP transporter solute-binding subunit n=1 Tax=Cloacibacillus sp. TaxID=2049023 RepID=UPI0025C0E17F|nr:TAXI family TRAP transporter solute-binding subunit [Cloacibacillus sp.]MCC8058472.1 TAXI family TRAP transporter solute-binding subunit [Cloacibacillus sp.]
MKKSRVLISMVILALFASAAFATTFVTIGSGGVGGTYYPLGGVMAELLTKGNVDIKATSRSTAASKENCRLVASNKAQIGMTMGSTLYQAYTGTEAFKDDGKLPLLTLMHMYAAPQHLVTTTRTGIKKFSDIKGKKVSLGAQGGGDQLLSLMILDAAGMDPDKDLRKQQLSQPEAVTALKDGNIDAAFFNFAVPGSAVMEIAAVRDVVLIPLPDDVIAKVTAKHPFLMPYTITKGSYTKQDQDVKTVADGNFLVVNNKLPEKVAYDMVKIFIEKKEDIMKVTPQAVDFTPQKAGIGIIPFHKGAAKYFKEKGVNVESK